MGFEKFLLAQHPAIAVLFLVGFLAVASYLTKREFSRLERRLNKQDEKMEEMSDAIGELEKDQADSRRDREGLHHELVSGFRTVAESLKTLDRHNTEAHQMIMRMVERRNGVRKGPSA